MQDIIEQTISAADNNERRYITDNPEGTDTNKQRQQTRAGRFDGVNASF